MTMSDEDRLREEAARRAERRRKKLVQGEERLAKITGQPIGSGPKVSLDLPDLSYYEIASNGSVVHQQQLDTPVSSHRHEADDPPLEQLVRGPAYPSAATPVGPASAVVAKQCSHLVWVALAILVYLVLQTSWSNLVTSSAILPFLLTFFSLCATGHISLQSSSTVSSLITAALMLCGLNASVVSTLLSILSGFRTLSRCFCVYLFSLICIHVAWESIFTSWTDHRAAF